MCIVYAWRPPKDDNFLSCCEKNSLGLRTGSLTLADAARVARAARACGHGVVSGDLFLRLLRTKDRKHTGFCYLGSSVHGKQLNRESSGQDIQTLS